jgi:phage terminase large subunit GpA-like protein
MKKGQKKKPKPETLNTRRLLAELRQIFTPPPLLSVDEWADQFRVLHTETAGIGGQWTTDKMPAFREIMHCYTDPRIKRIIIKGAVRTGKTQSLVLNPIGYHVDQDPRRLMIALPDRETMDDFVNTKLDPLLRNTECLRSKVHPGGRQGGRNNATYKSFNGGAISIANANLAVSFRQREVDTAIGDEIDAWPLDCEGEGDPVKLLENRTTNSPQPKIILISSPKFTESSRIDKAYKDSTQEIWQIPCPGCGAFQELSWERMKFGSATMTCINCQADFNQWQWLAGSIRGRWFALSPGHHNRGFWITGLISPWLDWAELIDEFCKAVAAAKLGDITGLKVFKNTILAQTWDETLGQKLDEEILFGRREVYEHEIPDKALILTAGVDTQDAYLAFSIWAWGADHECWAIETGIIDGDPLSIETWDELDRQVFNREWEIGGQVLKISRLMIDYQGHRTDAVYRYTRTRAPRCYACRGIGGESKTAFTNFQPKDGKPSRVEFAVDSIKAELVTRLQVEEPGPAFVHFPKGEADSHVQGFSFDWFKTLCCERRTERTVNGYTQYIWTKPAHQRNEGIDTFAYAWGALLHLGGGRILEYEALRRQKLKEASSDQKDKAEQKPPTSRFGNAPVVTYTRIPTEQTGTPAATRSRWGS